KNGFAYIADDGIYFSIDAYKKSGKVYGQLVDLTSATNSEERIKNDEYDKESLHDFALWKRAKEGEPSWEFEIDGQSMAGRPGWHIECSAMSTRALGQPFDIHTGGIDLKFPHHENEIAQSTAGRDDPIYATTFVHNDHILVDGQKMAKSAGNFYTLADLQKEGVEPLAFRLLVLQSHYRSPTNFSLTNVHAASNRLHNWRAIATLRHQTHDTLRDDDEKSNDQNNASLLMAGQVLLQALQDDIDTPRALAIIDDAFHTLENTPLSKIHRQALVQFLEEIDELLGLQLLDTTPDIDDEAKQLIISRQRAREEKDWAASDKLRESLRQRNIGVRDATHGTIWYYET
ncbi:cysteine--tRNA ligase, partial [Candidatus Saccharibacteria bacterium]|nr:cysteine--tRNA ligase [Candidatus Saccharibacteria bacterium]